MSTQPQAGAAAELSAPKSCPLEAIDRRVLGVLIEKAKTTPDNYPLSLKALIAGANQKSNRFPQMELNEDQVEESLDRLRTLGAVCFIQGDGRVEKYRHLAYDWLGVSKVELAIMAELLLRGAQTVGELRGRAARMEPIKGMAELEPLLESLQAKSLVVYLTPPGRGAVVTHNLYQPQEMAKVRREHEGANPDDAPLVQPDASLPTVRPPARPDAGELDPVVSTLREEIASLRSAITSMRDEIDTKIEALQGEIAELQRQLGV